MRRALIPCIFLLGVVFPSFAFQAPQNNAMNTDEPYQQQWQEIDSLERQGLPRSALEKVETLYARIDREKEPAQSLKCLLYINKYERELNEDGTLLMISNLEKEISQSKFPVRSILQSILAQVYANYLDNNFWQISERTVVEDVDESDPSVWPAEKFRERITDLYLASVAADEQLWQVPIEEWTALLTEEEGETDQLRPTLYDFLAHRAIDFFMEERYFLPEPVYAYYIDRDAYFAPPADFVGQKLEARDSASFKFRALTLFQQALGRHLADESPAALIDLDLKRLRFVHQHATLENKEQLYRDALQARHEQYQKDAASAEILYNLAQSYYQTGSSYGPPADTANRWDLKQAYEICQLGATRFPNSYGAAYCRQLMASIERKELSLRTEEVYLPERPMLALLEFRNLPKVYFRLVRMDESNRMEISKMRTEELRSLLYDQKPLRTWSESLPDTKDFQKHSAEIKIDALERGLYAILISSDPAFPRDGSAEAGYIFTQVSNLAYINQYDNEGQTEFVVVDRAGGQPLESVLLEFYGTRYNREERRSDYVYLSSVYTDKQGKATPRVPDNQYYQVKFQLGKDVLFFPDGYSKYTRYTDEREAQPQTAFFLDRAIYRPGQTIYFKGLAYSTKENELPRILANQKVTVTLMDVNGQEAGQVDLRTNAYGTFNGTFQAPRGGLLGTMHLSSSIGNSTKYFRVEEYKRPKFEVTLDTLAEDYQLGDTVTVTGLAKAYAGSVIDGAQVQYRVVREVQYPWRPWWSRRIFPPRSETMEIQSGQVTTDTEGTFSIRFPAPADPQADPKQHPIFLFRVYVDVTDITGETHSAEKSARLGYVGLLAEINVPEQLDRSDYTAPIKTENLEGQFQAATGKVTVHRLQSPDRIFLERYWSKPDMHILDRTAFESAFPQFAYDGEDEMTRWAKEEMVFSTTFNSANARELTLPAGEWPVGHYWLELSTTDSKGNPITGSRYFWVYDAGAKEIPSNIVSWVPEPKPAYAPGETFSFQLASADPEVQVLWGLERKEEMQREEWTAVRGWSNVPYTVAEEDKGNVFFHYSFIKDNRAYQGTQKITVPWTDKQLKIEFSTFRDKLQPGAEEEWRIKISGPDKEAVAAELVASMYDQSLDVFAPNEWDFFPYEVNSRVAHRWRAPHFSDQQNNRLGYYYTQPEVPNRRYRELDLSLLFLGRQYLSRGRAGVALEYRSDKMLQMAAAPVEAAEGARMEDAVAKSAGDLSQELTAADTVAEQAAPQAPPIRKNLEETVFFFPELRTDADGNVILRFTMKEALTRWKLLLLAHTKELEIGTAVRSVETQKELMVMPNPPRFLREGDTIEFTAKVSNLAESAQKGAARIELFDPLSGAVITDQLLVSAATLDFTAPAGQSAGFSWKLKVPAKGIQAVGHRVIAQSGSYSDGEESVLPVLTNRVLVTETMPLTVDRRSTQTFDFTAMEKAAVSPTLEHQKFSLEFTSNPAWYAVKALPYLIEFPYECTEQIFGRYYANSLASSVANEHPQIRQVFEDWKNTKGLESELMKNEELKAVLLEETPWVLEAQSEAQQRQQLGLLFDLHRMAEEQSAALYKMVERQSSDGGFAWFPGGRDSWYITQYIVEGLGHLQALGVQDIAENSVTKQMIRKAVAFIDSEMLLQYVELVEKAEAGKVKLEEDHLHRLAIHYLYARSFFPDLEMSEEVQEAHRYYIDQANRYWLAKGLYEQGLLALALHRNRGAETPAKIVRSLRERALRNEELGMYWKYDRGFFWYEMPIETHALMIEVFMEVGKDPETVDQLKRWLLRNKQTTHWKTTKATASAVYALLHYGGNWLLNEQDVQIRFSEMPRRVYQKKVADAQSTAEAGTGYFRVDWTGEEITPDLSRVKIRNDNNNLAWGALYWQYLEEADKVSSFQDTPLTIDKRVYKTVQTDRGPELVEIDAEHTLAPGDKLTVRIELRVDRDMEYVHMKDMRASGLEPLNVFSHYQWRGGLGYYESTKDAATHFFFDYLPRGTHVFEYPLRVIHKGDFSNGITTIQCMYAPEFTSHSEGIRLRVGE